MLKAVLVAPATFAVQCFIVASAHAYDDLEMSTLNHAGVQRSVGLYVPPSYRAGDAWDFLREHRLEAPPAPNRR